MAVRIVLLNDGLGPNKGDQAILRAMRDTLVAALPDAGLSVVPYRWEVKRVPGYLWAIRKADLVLLGGGQALHDQTSLAFTIRVLGKVALARILRKRIMGYGIGVGPLKTRMGRWLTRLLINSFEAITVRDPLSQKELEALGITRPPVTVTADASFLLKPASAERVEEILNLEGLVSCSRPFVAIAPRRWFHYHHGLIPVKYRARLRSGLRGEEAFERLKQILAGVADWLMARQNASIFIIPMRCASGRIDPGQDDDRVASEIMQRVGRRDHVRILGGDYSPEDLKGFLGRMDLIVGMRMHALILGGSMGVPILGIGVNAKFDPFFTMMGQDAYLLDVEALDEKDLREKISDALSGREQIRQELLRRTKTLKARAIANNQQVLKLLNRFPPSEVSFP